MNKVLAASTGMARRKLRRCITLVAKDTVEEKIYQLLNSKLREIAAHIGKLDTAHRGTG